MRDQDFFWEGVEVNRLLFQKCADCGAVRHPPGPMCPHCQSLCWAPCQSVGRGIVSAWIISKHPTQPDEEPRVVALIELDEGIRLISNLQGIGQNDVVLGMPVEAFFAEVNGMKLPQFRPAGRA